MKDKNIIKTGIVLTFFYFSFVGRYLELVDNEFFYNNRYLLSVLDLIIISVVMMIVPFIYKMKNKNVSLKKGKKVCLLNSIGMFVLSVVQMFCLNNYFIGGIGAVLYYFINKWVFFDVENTQLDDKEIMDIQNKKIEKMIPVIRKKMQCSNGRVIALKYIMNELNVNNVEATRILNEIMKENESKVDNTKINNVKMDSEKIKIITSTILEKMKYENDADINIDNIKKNLSSQNEKN